MKQQTERDWRDVLLSFWEIKSEIPEEDTSEGAWRVMELVSLKLGEEIWVGDWVRESLAYKSWVWINSPNMSTSYEKSSDTNM